MEKGYEYEIMQFFTWNESEGECRVKLRWMKWKWENYEDDACEGVVPLKKWMRE